MKRVLAVLAALALLGVPALAHRGHGGIGAGGGGALTITAPGGGTTLTSVVNGQPFAAQLNVAGGDGHYALAITSGPSTYNNGLMFLPGGLLTGVANLVPPNVAENDTFTVQAWDNSGHTGSQTFTLAVSTASGSIGISTGATLPAGSVGASYFAPVQCINGVPPYYETLSGHTSNTAPTNSAQSYGITTQGQLQFAPTTSGADTFTVECQDIAGHSFTSTANFFSAAISNAIAFSTPINMPPGMQGAKYKYQMRGVPTSGSCCTYTVLSGAPPGLSLSSAGLWTGTETGLGLYTPNIQISDGGSHSTTQIFNMAFAKNAIVSRPSYNSSSSNGLFVLNGQLYDANGVPVRIRGVNRNHIDQTSSILVPSNAPFVRVFAYAPSYSAATSYSSYINPQFISQGIVPIITQAVDSAGNGTSGSNVYGATSGSNAGMGTILQLWQSWYSASATYMDKIIANVANEWGKDVSSNYVA
ncbi:MAG TPA: putative Ig domain-containing protein, partial [Acetobacteraceae bacterium]|nr:putative Ig domain-containing protein [Acetobacteraceae bacterium]